MATCGTVFCAAVTDLTDAEQQWWKDQLEIVELPEGGEAPAGLQECPNLDPEDCDGGFYAFEWDFRDQTVVFHSGESGNPAMVAWLVQQFLKKFRPRQSWGLVYAALSTRLGDCSGGAYFVTAHKIEWFGARRWLERRMRAFEKKQIALLISQKKLARKKKQNKRRRA